MKRTRVRRGEAHVPFAYHASFRQQERSWPTQSAQSRCIATRICTRCHNQRTVTARHVCARVCAARTAKLEVRTRSYLVSPHPLRCCATNSARHSQCPIYMCAAARARQRCIGDHVHACRAGRHGAVHIREAATQTRCSRLADTPDRIASQVPRQLPYQTAAQAAPQADVSWTGPCYPLEL